MEGPSAHGTLYPIPGIGGDVFKVGYEFDQWEILGQAVGSVEVQGGIGLGIRVTKDSIYIGIGPSLTVSW